MCRESKHSSSTAVAAPQPQPQQQQRRGGSDGDGPARWIAPQQLGLARSITTNPTLTHNSQFLFFRNKCRRHQQQPMYNSRSAAVAAANAAAAAEAAAAAAVVRRGWRWRWTLRRQRCGIATVIEKISIEYDNITQQQRTRSS